MLPSLLSQWKMFLVSLTALAVSITPTPPASQQTFSGNAPNVPNASGTSRNWAGYAATNGIFTSVNGTWTIPSVTGNSHTAADATWVGIGGIKTSDLIQAGTQNIINPSGQVTTSAFYELLPNTSLPIPVSVKAGDSISVSINQTSTNQWQITFTDNTTNQSNQTAVAYTSSLSSAEWIEEAPSNGQTILPLDIFGTISYSAGSTIQNGNQQSISGSQAQAITMINTRGQAIATTSSLGSDGASFTITRTSAAANTPVTAFDRNPRGFRRHGFGIGGFTPYPGRGWQFQWITATPTPSDNPTLTPTVTQTPVETGIPSGKFLRRRFYFRGKANSFFQNFR